MSEPLLVPNSTQVPNIVLDILGPLLLHSEYRCLMYVIRRTYGFRKPTDEISLNQFVHGLISKDGTTVLDFGTGLTTPPIIAALKFLGRIGIVDRTGGGPGRGNKPTYQFNPSCRLVQLLDEWRQEPEQARAKMASILTFFRKCKDDIAIATIDIMNIDFQSLPFSDLKGKVDTPEKVYLLYQQNKDTKLSNTRNQDNNIRLPSDPNDPGQEANMPPAEDHIGTTDQQSHKPSKSLPKSKQPGIIPANIASLILSMVSAELHCVVNPNVLNEVFWTAQSSYAQRTGCSMSEILAEVDRYWSTNQETLATTTTEKGARKRLGVSIDIAIKKLLAAKREHGRIQGNRITNKDELAL